MYKQSFPTIAGSRLILRAWRGKFLVLSFGFVLLALRFTLLCYAQSISSVELINNAKNYDGNTLVYKGEIIGDIMARGEYAWINVNDEKNAIGVWIKKELIKDINYTGNYKTKGDLVEVAGKFNRSCVEHGGDLDIHAWSLIKINSGNKVSHMVNRKEINFAIGLFLTITLTCLLRVAIPFGLNKGYQKE